jgi:hypothetical protein
MKSRWLLLVSMVLVGVVSSLSTILFLNRDAIFSRPNFDGRWEPLAGSTPQPSTLAALQVIDDTRDVLSLEEQKALFGGLSDRLNDPASAQLRRLRRSTNRLSICGELNAKNGFGGYVGFVPFAGVITGGTAILTMPTREVALNMPTEISASFEKLGCSEKSPVSQTSVPKQAITLGAMAQFNGNITSSNVGEFTEFIGKNSGKVIMLKVSLNPKEIHDPSHEVWGDEKAFRAFTEFSKINATSGFQYENGVFIFDGIFFVEYAGVVEGAVYVLKPVKGSLMKSGIGLAR